MNDEESAARAALLLVEDFALGRPFSFVLVSSSPHRRFRRQICASCSCQLVLDHRHPVAAAAVVDRHPDRNRNRLHLPRSLQNDNHCLLLPKKNDIRSNKPMEARI